MLKDSTMMANDLTFFCSFDVLQIQSIVFTSVSKWVEFCVVVIYSCHIVMNNKALNGMNIHLRAAVAVLIDL